MTNSFPNKQSGPAADQATSAARMNQIDDRELERLIDRLVDNELPQLERRSLLLELDRRPQGWRRCALAFLEAQAWNVEGGLANLANESNAQHKSSFADICSDVFATQTSYKNGSANGVRLNHVARFRITAGQQSAEKKTNGHSRHGNRQDAAARVKYLEISPSRGTRPRSTPARNTPTERTTINRPDDRSSSDRPSTDRLPPANQAVVAAAHSTSATQRLLNSRTMRALRSPGGLFSAMSACFLLAFMLGLAIRGGGDNSGITPDNTANTPGVGAIAQNSNTQQSAAANNNGIMTNVADVDPGMNRTPANRQNVSGSGTWGTVSLASNSSDPGAPALELPVVDGPSMTDWFSTLPPPVRPETLAELRRTGHVVTTETQWVTVQLEDGRFAVVPVDEVQVRYVGGNYVQ